MSSLVRQLVDSVKDTGTSALQTTGMKSRHVSAVGELVETGISAGIVGGALGMASGQLAKGLDSGIGALDGWAALALGAASVARQGHDDSVFNSANLRQGAGQAFGIFTFRQFEKFFQAKRAAQHAGETPGRDYDTQSAAFDRNYGDANGSPGAHMNGEDPVLHAGKNL